MLSLTDNNYEQIDFKITRDFTSTIIEKILSQREVIQTEPELTTDIVNRLKTRIQNQKHKK